MILYACKIIFCSLRRLFSSDVARLNAHKMASAGSLNERIFQQEKWSRAIRKHSPNLRVWLHASSDDIANIMVVREAFTESERITVLGGSSGIDKMDKIMDYVKGKDSWVSETFCAILDELGHSDSADLLRKDAGQLSICS